MGSRWEQGSPGWTAGWRPVRRTEPLDSQLLEVGSRLCFSSRKTAASLSPRCLEQRGNPSRERGGHVKPRSLCRSNSSASLQTSCWRAVLGHGSYRSHLQKGLLRPLRAGRGKGPLWTPNANEPVAKMACVVLLLVSPSQPACGAWTIPYTRGGGGTRHPVCSSRLSTAALLLLSPDAGPNRCQQRSHLNWHDEWHLSNLLLDRVTFQAPNSFVADKSIGRRGGRGGR